MDLASAEYLCGMCPVPIEIICYHCEQAAEKLLKGVLVSHDIEAPKTHDLVQLCKLCEDLDPEYAQLFDACVELTPYGVQVRYPSNLELDEHDMECALSECRNVDSFISSRLSVVAQQDQQQEQEQEQELLGPTM